MKLKPALNKSPHGYAQSVVRRLNKNNRAELEKEIDSRSDSEMVRKEINRLRGVGDE